eukprot:g6014.t1
MGSSASKRRDSTAMGVAKVRLIENLFPENERCFSDPYACYHCPGQFIMKMIGCQRLKRMFDSKAAGMYAMLVVRTRWIDDALVEAAFNNQMKQVLILGAGYDMRGNRLSLPEDVTVFEIDHPQVQRKKRKNNSKIENLTNRRNITYLPVDFTTQTLDVELQKCKAFDSSKPCFIVIEGLSQYIPKDAFATTLNAIQSICGKGSKFAISYVDQNVYDDIGKVCGNAWNEDKLRTFLNRVSSIGEPWITAFRKEEFSKFLKEKGGITIQEDISPSNLCIKYLSPLGRPENIEEHKCDMERYVLGILG